MARIVLYAWSVRKQADPLTFPFKENSPMTQREALNTLADQIDTSSANLNMVLGETYLPGAANNVRVARAKVLEAVRSLEEAQALIQGIQDRTARVLGV
jgi:hypothetical protein